MGLALVVALALGKSAAGEGKAVKAPEGGGSREPREVGGPHEAGGPNKGVVIAGITSSALAITGGWCSRLCRA
jgi:hypothetical protein